MPDHSEPAPAFLVTAHGSNDLTARQVRHPRYPAPSRGVRLPADSPGRAPELEAAAMMVTAADASLCDVSAARHWNLPLPPWIGLQMDDRPVGVAVPAGRARARRTGVRGRRLDLPAEHLVTRSAVQVTIPARTWIDCAELIPLEHVVAMGDAILRGNLASRGELAGMVSWGVGRRGIRLARAALPMLDPHAESPSESVVRCHLIVARLPPPICNLDIIVDGEWLARADLAWPRERVIVEYDGAEHLDERRRRSDAARRNLLQDRGWLVIVFTAADLQRPWAMADLVRSALRTRAGVGYPQLSSSRLAMARGCDVPCRHRGGAERGAHEVIGENGHPTGALRHGTGRARGDRGPRHRSRRLR